MYSIPDDPDALFAAGGGPVRILGAGRGEELIRAIGPYDRDSRAGTFVVLRLPLYCSSPELRLHDSGYRSQPASRQVETLAGLAQVIQARHYGRVILKPGSELTGARPLFAAGWWAIPARRVAFRWATRIVSGGGLSKTCGIS